MKLALYSVTDKKISQYNLYFLASLREVFDEVAVTANFEISEKEQNSLNEIGVTRYYSVPEYSLRLQHWLYFLSQVLNFKFDNIEEILFCSGTDYGPVYPLERLLSDPKTQQCDAWGLLRKEKYHNEQASDFFAVTKKTINSEIFKEYWNKVKNCKLDELKDGVIHLGAYLKNNKLRVNYLFSVGRDHI